MNRKWFSFLGLCAMAAMLLSLANCARNQHLVAITVTPPGATFQGVGAQIQFTATGIYIHPPENKDITSQAKWSIDSQNLATVTSSGFVTATSICGSGNLYAKMNDGPNVVSGSAFLTGSGIGTSACNQALLQVNITGTGTVVSSPAGINCPSACSAVFTLNSPVGLTATPTGTAKTASWTGCTTSSGNSCSVTMSTNVTVGVLFQ